MTAEELIQKILYDKMQFKKKRIYDEILLTLPKLNFELLKNHYTSIINIPVMSIILQDKTELPMDRLFGMDIEVRDIVLDYALTIKNDGVKP